MPFKKPIVILSTCLCLFSNFYRIAATPNDSNSFDAKERNLLKSQIEHMQKRIEQLTAVQEQADPAGKLKIFTDRIKELESKLAASQAETKVFRDVSASLKKRSKRNSDDSGTEAPEAKVPKVEIKREELMDSLIKSNEELANAMKDFGFMIDSVLADAGTAVSQLLNGSDAAGTAVGHLLNGDQMKIESPTVVSDESSNGGGDCSLTADIETY